MSPQARRAPKAGLTVALTGPTGDIGTALVNALERSDAVERILGMARRPFDPAARGWRKLEYRQGDVLDRDAVDALVADADVVVHLAFIIVGALDESRRVNLEGSRNVFEAALQAAHVKRLVYASSVAAYGFHADNPQPLTEDVAPRGTDAFYYSAQKAELEGVLGQLAAGSDTDVYVFRPSIVAGPDALALIENLPYVQAADRLPDAMRSLLGALPGVTPVLPDPGVAFQLVHAEDVADAMGAAISGHGPPGAYNLAAPGVLTMTEFASALGWRAVPIPEQLVGATAALVNLVPGSPPQAAWVNAFRVPVIMDTTRARTDLGWTPKHDVQATLAQTVAAARAEGLLG